MAEAAEALAIVEALEAAEAQEAQQALEAAAGRSPMADEWEVATRGRRVRREKPSDSPATLAEPDHDLPPDATGTAARAARRKGGAGAADGGAGEEEEERTAGAEGGRPRRRKGKPKQPAATDAASDPTPPAAAAAEAADEQDGRAPTPVHGTPEPSVLPGTSLLQMPTQMQSLSLGESPAPSRVPQPQPHPYPPAAAAVGGLGLAPATLSVAGFEIGHAEPPSYASGMLMPNGGVMGINSGRLYDEPEEGCSVALVDAALHTPTPAADLPTGGKRQGKQRSKGRELEPAAAAASGAGGSVSSSSSTSSCTGSSGGAAPHGAGGQGRRSKSARTAATASSSAGAVDDEATSLGAAAAPGLENKTGQHSCFVNVVVQTLWNVGAFRDAFLKERAQLDASEEDRSIFSAMAEVCAMMEGAMVDDASAADATAGKASPPKPQATASALKEALYRLDSSFELGEMHDATEAHEALLEALHRATKEHAADAAADGGGGAPGGGAPGGGTPAPVLACNGGQPPMHGDLRGESFIKRIFSMQMRLEFGKPADPNEEQSKPILFDQWTQYVNAWELREVVRAEHARPAAADRRAPPPPPLVRMLRKVAGTEELSEGAEGSPGSGKTRMLVAPRVFTLGLASNTAHATKSEISESLDGIEERLNLRHIYEGITEDVHCRLQALTAFYESHYVCFCFSHNAGQWIHYDDDTRRLVGADFAAVKDKCVAGRLHPQLLFFERVD